jgi:hypothetical protein
MYGPCTVGSYTGNHPSLGIKAFLMNELEFVGIGEEVIKM